MFFRGFSGRGGLKIVPPPTDGGPNWASEEKEVPLESDLAEGESLTETVGILVGMIDSSSEELPHPLAGTSMCTSPSPASSLAEFLVGGDSDELATPNCSSLLRATRRGFGTGFSGSLSEEVGGERGKGRRGGVGSCIHANGRRGSMAVDRSSRT